MCVRHLSIICVSGYSEMFHSHKRQGFTLVEILIAIFILALVLSTIYGAYTGTLRIVRQTDREDEIYGMARSTMKRMVADIGAICRYGNKFVCVSQTSEMGDTLTELMFLARSHVDFERGSSSSITGITFYVVEGEAKDEYVLMRNDVLHAGDGTAVFEKDNGHILAQGITSIMYTFYDKNGNEFERWDSGTDEHKDKAPAVVAIHMEFDNPDNEDTPYRFMTKVYIPAAGEDK
jgi:general secretion pathway protein J